MGKHILARYYVFIGNSEDTMAVSRATLIADY